jgi:predicted DNA binding protein
MAPMDKVMDLKESLKGIGKVTYFKVQPVKSTRDVLLVVMRNNMMFSYVRLALAGSELNTLRSVWKLGYFNLNNRPTLSDVSVMLNKNKSTIDRQIKSAIHKLELVNYVVNIT